MTSNRSFSNFSFFLGIFFLWSGCCLGASPVLHLGPLTVERSCPIEDIDFISANVTLDMTGVDYDLFQPSVGLGERDIVRSDFKKGTCDDSLTHLYCVKQDGDFFGFEYHQPINGFYSGMKMFASMWDTDSLNSVKSPEVYTYPMTANSATITVTVNNQTKQWRSNESQTFEFKDLDPNEPFNVSYMVRDNIQWAPDYKIGLKSTNEDLSTTDLNITTVLPAGTKEFEISWQAGPCGQTVLIKLSEKQDTGDDDDDTPLIIGLTVGCIFIVAVVGGLVYLFVFKRNNNIIRVVCSHNAKLDVLEGLAKNDPIVKKYIEDNNLGGECQIRNKNDEVVSNKRTTVSNLMDGEPSSRVTVVIKHVMDTDKKTLILRVMDVKMIKDSEGREMDSKGDDMGQHNFQRQ